MPFAPGQAGDFEQAKDLAARAVSQHLGIAGAMSPEDQEEPGRVDELAGPQVDQDPVAPAGVDRLLQLVGHRQVELSFDRDLQTAVRELGLGELEASRPCYLCRD